MGEGAAPEARKIQDPSSKQIQVDQGKSNRSFPAESVGRGWTMVKDDEWDGRDGRDEWDKECAG